MTSNAEPFSEVDLYDIVHEVLSDLEVTNPKNGREKYKSGTFPSVQADPAQMRQLFQNLIGNALKFHKDGEKPLVNIRSTTTETGARVFIEDNGIGFEEQYLDKIFAAFPAAPRQKQPVRRDRDGPRHLQKDSRAARREHYG